jgi:hypothetical protein
MFESVPSGDTIFMKVLNEFFLCCCPLPPPPPYGRVVAAEGR